LSGRPFGKFKKIEKEFTDKLFLEKTIVKDRLIFF